MAVENLLSTVPEDPKPEVLWAIFYTKEHAIPESSSGDPASSPDDPASSALHNRILQLQDIPPGVSLEDDLLRNVRAAWEKITGGEGEGFMQFADREGLGNEGDEEQDI